MSERLSYNGEEIPDGFELRYRSDNGVLLRSKPCKPTKLERYLHRENSIAAKAARKISSLEGKAYRQSTVKKAVEIPISAVGAVLAAPLVTGALAAQYLEDGCNPIYKKRSVLKKSENTTFDVLKLRSMHPGADKVHDSRNGADGDERITKVGKVTRKTNIDDALGLLQVLKGTMSLIEMRPATEKTFTSIEAQVSPDVYQEYVEGYDDAEKLGVMGINSGCNPRRKDFQSRTAFERIWINRASVGMSGLILYKHIENPITDLIDSISQKVIQKFFPTQNRWELVPMSPKTEEVTLFENKYTYNSEYNLEAAK